MRIEPKLESAPTSITYEDVMNQTIHWPIFPVRCVFKRQIVRDLVKCLFLNKSLELFQESKVFALIEPESFRKVATFLTHRLFTQSCEESFFPTGILYNHL